MDLAYKQMLYDSAVSFYSKQNCSVLLMQEVGSWSWGYNAVDSDHDMLVVYKHNQPEQLLFNKSAVNMPLVEHSFELSHFLELMLKFNFNAFAYCQVAYDHSTKNLNSSVLCSEHMKNLCSWYNTECAHYRKAVLQKLFVQLLSQLKSYYTRSQYSLATLKDLVRLAYMSQLVVQCQYQLLTHQQLNEKYVLDVKMLPFDQFKSLLTNRSAYSAMKLGFGLLNDLEKVEELRLKYTTVQQRKMVQLDELRQLAFMLYNDTENSVANNFAGEKFALPQYSVETKVSLYTNNF